MQMRYEERFGPDVHIEADVTIGEHTIIHPGTRIGRGSVIGSFCELGIPAGPASGKGLEIGPDALIRSHSIFYAGSVFGPRLRTGHRATVRENIRAGDTVQIGTLSVVEGGCTIGDHVRIHTNVFVAQGATIGDFALLFPYVVLTNDSAPPSDRLEGVTIRRYAVVAANATVLPGVVIGEGALVGAMTLVRDDVPADMVCVGVPGRVVGSTSRIRLKHNGEPAYPWRRHFHRGYPEQVVEQWKREFAQQPDGAGVA
jgi:acetyltransferase-like isoleucine patch superfamily enzyme